MFDKIVKVKVIFVRSLNLIIKLNFYRFICSSKDVQAKMKDIRLKIVLQSR